MQVGSMLSPHQRDKPRIFSTSNHQLFTKSSISNSTSQPSLEISLNDSIKTNNQYNQYKNDNHQYTNDNHQYTNDNHQYTNDIRPVSSKTQQQNYQLPTSQLDKSVQISLLKIQNKNLKQQNQQLNQTVTKLRKQLTDKVSTLQRFNQLMKIKYTEIKSLKTQIQTKTNTINTLQEQTSTQITSQQAQKLKQQYLIKSSQLDQLLTKINNLQHQNFTNQIFQMKISKLNDQLFQEKDKNHNLLIEKSQLTQTINQLKENVQSLTYQNKRIITTNKVEYQSQQIDKLFNTLNQIPITSSPTKQSKQSQHLNAFEQALKVQLKQIEELKKTLQNSQQITQILKDNLITSRRQLQQLRGQMKIINLKQASQRKKLIMEYRLQLHQKDNQINNSLKKYKTLDQKYKTALNDIKAKDDFLRQHLLGRLTDITAQQYVDSVLKQYTQNFQHILDLKTQNAELTQKSEKYLKYEQQIETGLLQNKTTQQI